MSTTFSFENQPLPSLHKMALATIIGTSALWATSAAAQFSVDPPPGLPPPSVPLPIQSSLYDDAFLPPGYENGVIVDIEYTTTPATNVDWRLYETIPSDCFTGRPPTLPPSATNVPPLGARLTETTSSPVSKLFWPPDTSAVGLGGHCLAIEGCDTSGVCRVAYTSFDVFSNPPAPAVAPPRAFSMHAVTAVEGTEEPVGVRLYAENMDITPPITPATDLCVKRCPQFPNGTANCNSSCGLMPPWVDFEGDTLTWTFEPPYGTRGPWEFTYTHPDLDTNVPTIVLDVISASRARPRVKEALWAADFGGPYRIPLETFTKEQEVRNDNLNTAPYFDRGYLSGEIEPAGDIDAFIFHVGTNEWHRFTTRRSGIAPDCVFPATLSIYDITDRLPTDTLATVMESQSPVESVSGVGANGCAEIDTLQLDNQSIYLLAIEHRDGAVGYDYVVHHEVLVEEVEDDENTSTYSPALRAEALFEPGVVGTFSSSEDIDWGWIHLQSGNTATLTLSRTDGTCTGLSSASIAVVADDGTTLYEDDADTGAAFVTTVDGCPEGTITVPTFAEGSLEEARYNIAVTGATGTYELGIDRRLNGTPNPPPSFDADLLDISDPANAIRPGTCGAVQAFLLDDYAEGASFFGGFISPLGAASLACNGFGLITTPSGPVPIAPDPYGICRPLFALPLNDPQEEEWELVRTQFGTLIYTDQSDANPVQVLAMAADLPPGIGNAAGLAGGEPTIITVDPSSGEFGNDFYYDPYGECDVQTYPSPICKGDAAVFVPPEGVPNFCRLNAPKRFLEGQHIEFEMTRWNRSAPAGSGAVTVETAFCDGGSCTAETPSVAPTYDFDNDVLAWDIPYDLLDGEGIQEVHIRLTYNPSEFGGSGDPAQYVFQFFVRDLEDPGSFESDVGIVAMRLAEPLARVDIDTRVIHKAFQSTDRSAARHASNTGYFQFATNTTVSRTVGVEDRIQLHPQFESGRLTQGSGPPTFEILLRNTGETTNTAGTADVFLMPATVDAFGNFASTAPTGEDSPMRTLVVPAFAAGEQTSISFKAPTADLLGVSGSEPWIAASSALYVRLKVDGDEHLANDLFGPVYVTPARPPQACEGCNGDPSGGFAGAYSSSKDITGVIASMSPESPKSGDLVTVNVQVQFSGTGFTDDGVIRFYVDQDDAPTSLTTPHQTESFPSAPTAGTIYGYTFEFTATKPISGVNELPIRVYLDATNQYSEPGSGESNNQLPTNSRAESLEIENSVPTFPSTPPTEATEDILWSYEVQVADADAVDFDRLSVALTGPTGMEFADSLVTCSSIPSRKCVVLQWVPLFGDEGDHPVVVEACDGDPVAGGDGGCATQEFTVSVTEVNDAPVFSAATPATEGTEDVAYGYTFVASDEESSTLSWTLVDGPSGLTLTPAGDTLSATVAWVPGDTGVGEKAVQVRIEDGDGGSETVSWTIDTANVNDAPVLATAAGSDLTGEEGTLYTASFTITDVDNTLASQGQTFDCSASTFPSFLTVTTVGGACVISGTPGNTDTGAHSITVAVTDDGSPSLGDTSGYTLTVADAINATPVFAAVSTQAATQGSPFSLDIGVTDADFDSPGYSEDITFTIDGAVTDPTAIVLTDNGDSVNIAWTPTNAEVGANTIRVIATDVRGASTSRTFIVNVANVNDAPILTKPSNASLSEGGTFTGTLVATDPDGDTITYSLVSGAPPGFSVTADGDMTSGVTNDAQVGVWTILVQASDADGAFDNDTFTLTVNNVEEGPDFPALADDSAAEDSVYTRTIFALDPDPGDSVTFAFDGSVPTGMTIGSSNGELSWNAPADADVGIVTISIRATDENGNDVTREFDLTIANTNDAPVITSTAPTSLDEEEALSYTLTAADDDIDSGDSLTYSAPTLPTWMTFSPSTRLLSGTPDDAQVGDHSVVLRVTDESAATDEQAFTISVAAINDAPILTTIGGELVDGSPLAFEVDEGETLNIAAVATDVDSSTLSYSADLDGNTFETFTIDSETGAISFTPSFTEAGVYVIYVAVTDEGLLSDLEPVTLTVNNVNRAPVFAWTPDTTATEDTVHTDTALATDPDGDTVSFSLTVRPAGMTIAEFTGALSFTPDNDDVGSQSVTVRATDTNGRFTDESYTLVVANENDAPSFTSTAPTSVEEESLYTYTVTASDDDGDALTFSTPTRPTWLTFTPATRVLTGTPDDAEVGSHPVVVRVTDGNGGTTDQVFTIDVSQKNDAPTFVAPTPSGTVVGAEGVLLTFTAAATDAEGDTVSYTAVGLPTGATLNSSSGAFAWTPDFDASGSYPVTLRASDGILTTTRSLSLAISNTNRPPVVAAPSTAEVNEGESLAFGVSASDPDGDSVTLSMVSGPADANFDGTTLSWIPSFADAGTAEFVFRATANGQSTDASVDVTVVQVNQAPTLAAPSNTSATQDTSFVSDLQATDIDLTDGDVLTFALVEGPSGMALAKVGDDVGRLTWVPSAAQVGSFAVEVRVTDNGALTTTRAFNVSVANLNDAPIITSTAPTASIQGAAYATVLTATDADEGLGDTVTLSAPTLPTWLSFESETGSLSGTPTNADVGSHPVVLRAEDVAGAFDTQAFTIVVANVNDAPVIAPVDNESAAEGETIAFTVTATDIDGTGPTLTVAGLPADATFVTNTVGVTTTGTFNWTTDATDEGTYPMTFIASDGALLDTASMTVTVGNVNRPPELAAIGDQIVAEGETLALSVTATDPDAGATVTLSATGGSPNVFALGATFVPATGAFTWTPGFADAGTFAVTFLANDGALDDEETITITVVNTNRAPTFIAPTPSGTISGAEGDEITFSVAATDADGDTTTLTTSGLPTGANFSTTTGTFSWTPNFAQAGSYPIVVQVNDGTTTTPRPLTLSIANTDRAPVLTAPATATTTEGQLLSFSVTAEDPDGDSVTTTLLAGPTGATLTAGVFNWTPSFDETSPQLAVFRATAGGLTVDHTTTITVANTNRPPTLGAPSTVTAIQDTLYTATLDATDLDIATGASDTLTFLLVSGPSGASVVASSPTQAQISWTPGPLDVNPPTRGFTVRVTDAAGAIDDRSFDVSTTNTNDAPTLTPPNAITVDEGASVSLTLVAEDLDIAAGLADTLVFSLVTGPAGMTVDGATGALVWTSTDDQVGTETVTVRVTDAAGAFDTATFDVTVGDVADAPTFDTTPLLEVNQGELYQYVAAASDPDAGAGGTVTLSAPALPVWLSFSPGTGTLSGTPSNDDVGNHSVTLLATDGTGLSATQAFTVSVANVNDAPTIAPIAPQAVAEGATVQFSVSATDVDQDSVTVSFASATIPAAATFDGVTFTWATSFDDAGVYIATFTADDGALTTSEDVTITVGGSNRAPVLAAIEDQTIDEGQTLSLPFSANDLDGDTLTFSLLAVGDPSATDAGAALDGTGRTLLWTPGFNAAGTYEILTTVTDGSASDAQTFFVTVNDVNRPPVFSTAPVEDAEEDALYAATTLATDADGDTIAYSLTVRPAGMAIDAASGDLTFTPSNAAVGTHPVTIRADDGRGGVTTQSFVLTVTNVNDAPVFESTPVVGATEDSVYTYTASASDVDTGSVVTLSAPTLPSWLSFDPPTGTLTGTPGDADLGEHPVVLLATDETGEATSQDFTIVVTESNDAPVFVAPTPDGPLTVAEGDALVFTAAVSDPDGPALTFEASGLPAGASFGETTGVFAWTPSFSDAGTYSFTLIANDSLAIGTRAITVTVTQTDRAPTVTAPASITASEGQPLSFIVASEDADGDSVLVTAGGLPAGATFDEPSGAFAWTPDFESAGTVEVTFTATANGQTATTATTITVDNTNRPPVLISALPSSAIEDELLSATFVAEDPDQDAVTLTLVAGPANATFEEGELTWTPLGSQVGSRSFTVRLSDGNNGIVDIPFAIVVAPRNDAPVFISAPIVEATEDVDYLYDADGLDEDGDTLSYSLVDSPSGMTIDSQTGEVRWLPDNAAVGEHDVTLRVTDPDDASADQTFTVTVVNVNDAPQFGPGPGPNDAPFVATILENALFTWNTNVTDADVGDNVTLSLLGAPASMTIDGTSIEWTPSSSDVGNVVFRVRAQDTAGAITDVTLDLTVQNLNDAPFFLTAPISESTPEDSLWIRSILADDVDGDAVTFSLLNAPLGMTIEEDAGYSQLVFSPQEADVGVHDFIIRANDGNGGTTDQSATLEVTPVNDGPLLAAIANQAAQVDVELLVTLSLRTPDTDGPSTTYSLLSGPTGATVTGAQFQWTPTAAQTGPSTVTVSVTDGFLSDTETFVVVVGGGGLPPSISLPPDVTADEGTLISEPFIIASTDGQAVTTVVDGIPAGANFDEVTGQFTWVPSFTQSGTFTLEVSATDGNGTTEKTWNIVVRDVNRAPTLVQTTGEFEATESLVFNDNVGATDLDGDSLSYTVADGPDGLTIDGEGNFDWTPTFAQLGLHTLVVVVSDGNGGQTSGQYTIRVVFLDEDEDRLPDTYEVAVGLDPTVDDSGLNPDADGLVNLDEFLEGTDPFVSDAPLAPSLLAPADAARVLTETPTLTFAPGTDLNGFSVTHRVIVRSLETGVIAAQIDVEESGSAIEVTVADALEEAQTYEWSVLAVSFGGARESETRTFEVDAVNAPPPAPLLVAPVDDASVSTRTPILRAFGQPDPEREPTQIVFALRETQDGPAVIVTEPLSLGPAGGEVSIAVPELLNDGSIWLWSAYAVDSRGLQGATSGTRRFTVDLGNGAPPTPLLLSPVEGEVLTSPPLVLRTSASEDPEGLEVTTVVELAAASSFVDAIVRETTNVTNGEVSFVFDESELPVAPDGVWFWRVTATDGATYSEPASGSFVIDWTDEPPSEPTLLSPADNTLVFGTSVTLRASASVDPEGTAVAHRFVLLNGTDGTEIGRQESVLDGDDGVVDLEVEATFEGLIGGALYAWSVSAEDGVNAAVETPTFRFRVDATNERPQAPVLFEPSDAATVQTRRPLFVFSEAVDPDGDAVTHDFELWATETLVYRAENRGAEAGEVSVSAPMPLGNGDYLWRARGRDIGGGGTWSERTLTVDVTDAPDAGVDAGPGSDGGPDGSPDGGDGDGGIQSPDAGPANADGPIVVQFPSDGDEPTPSGCACSSSSVPDVFALSLLLLGLLGWRRRRTK